MKLAEALKLGLVKDVPKPERHIETWLSDVFLYENTARKITKYVSNKDFGDLTNFEERKQFYAADFAWNNLFAPEIYTFLQGLRETKNGWVECNNDEANDFYILMNRINADDTLINTAGLFYNKFIIKAILLAHFSITS
ncbi:MAG: hypothetical protein Q7S18_01530 [bacterium]|nr:hypothetical protein [bacterium]